MHKFNNIDVFLMHRVTPHYDPIWPPITPKLFEEIIIYLKKKHIPVQLENHFLENKKITENKKKYCALVFDDGYKDFIEYALPILTKHNFPSSMYVVTNCVDNNLPPWTYLINYLFTNTNNTFLDIESDYLPNQLSKVNWKSNKEKIQYANQISPFLKSIANKEAQKILTQIFNQLNDVELPHNLMMSWEDLKSIKSETCYIGSHSFSHPLLSKCTYTSEIEDELTQSFNAIKKNLGYNPVSISYPFGASDYRVLKTAQKVGYILGLNVNKINNFNQDLELYNIPRTELFNESFFKSKLRINGYIDLIKTHLKLKKSLSS